jgi:hypothetical protein
MLDNPGGCTCDSQKNPCDVTNDNQPAAMDALSSLITQDIGQLVKFIQLSKHCSPAVLWFCMHHGKKSLKGLKKPASTVLFGRKTYRTVDKF